MLQALWSELDTEHSFSIWYGWAPLCRDETVDRPDMAFSVEANVYVATYAIYTDPADDERYAGWVHRRTAELAAACGAGVYLGDTDFTRRQDRFCPTTRTAAWPRSAPNATRAAASRPT